MEIIALKILAVVGLVMLNGFFVAAEFALVKVRDTQLVAIGARRAKVARRILRNLDIHLSACQLGITLASLGLGWIGEPIFNDLLKPLWVPLGVESVNVQHTIAFLLGFSTITFLHITAGEQAPKWLAIQKPLPTSLWIARPLEWFKIVTYPFIWLLNKASILMLQWVGLDVAGEHEFHSEDELRLLFSGAHSHGGGSDFGRSIVLNAFDLHRRTVRDVMRPRNEIAVIDTATSAPELFAFVEKSRYSRYPVCRDGDLDQTLGVIHIKDLNSQRSEVKSGEDLLPFLKPLIYVPETARLDSLLKRLLDRRTHLAIVVSEYGDTQGIITLENILEELVGQIQDEFDQETPLFKLIERDIWQVQGALSLRALSNLVGRTVVDQGVSTVSGLVIRKLGAFPKPGDIITFPDYTIQVGKVQRLQVEEAILKRLRPEPEADSTHS